ncbi:tryptophan synthase beta subunit-like PLP-dependent enzyme [Lophiotrema nucula]|uniref:Tryptophan synthase beta subunit-like PLP-dependent enzyme n=1 Tax=Lophiotrema nucula TaxID=690887 RepID=A0A6A5YH65_9PLEO|nr:tryptophan synthase beta subunit-like PLP-dependent enzyme [Lophiotrema nucula]
MFINPSAASWKYEGPPADPSVGPFHRRLPDYNITPLVTLPNLAQELGLGHVVIKDESLRFGLPAFKILGASWAIYKAVCTECELPLTTSLKELGEAAKQRNIKLVTCTEGNWGRATARMAKYLGISATVFVPNDMTRSTQEKISGEGAKVVVVDGDYDVTIPKAQEEADHGNGLLVMDVSWKGYQEIPEWVVEGYSTMLTETDWQLEDIVGKPATHAIMSVGVGSWGQAVSKHYKSGKDQAKVIAVEPETAACLKASLEAGEMISITTGHTIMNGMSCGTVSYTAWDILRQGVDVSVAVSDKEAHEDVRYLHSQGVRNGPCGAAPLSALRRLCKEKEKLGLDAHSVVVLFSTEGARGYPVPA